MFSEVHYVFQTPNRTALQTERNNADILEIQQNTYRCKLINHRTMHSYVLEQSASTMQTMSRWKSTAKHCVHASRISDVPTDTVE